ncbi:MAG: hypothetical protein AAE977_04480 [Thermoplasmataceae archaeon]
MEERNVVSTTLIKEHQKPYFTLEALTGIRKAGNNMGKEFRTYLIRISRMR